MKVDWYKVGAFLGMAAFWAIVYRVVDSIL